MVEFLNQTFLGLDVATFNIVSGMATSAKDFFTPLFKIITLLGEKGIIFFVGAVALMLFKNTRKLGICMFGAVACGALITNVVLKDLVARPRPFEADAYYTDLWRFIGSPEEDGYSFPSGHVTAIASAMTAMFILCNKKWSWVGFVGVFIMGFARVYLIAHYASDVLAGIVVGVLSGVIAFFITKLIYLILEKYKEKALFKFVLESSFYNLFNKKKKKEEEITDNTEDKKGD